MISACVPALAGAGHVLKFRAPLRASASEPARRAFGLVVGAAEAAIWKALGRTTGAKLVSEKGTVAAYLGEDRPREILTRRGLRLVMINAYIGPRNP